MQHSLPFKNKETYLFNYAFRTQRIQCIYVSFAFDRKCTSTWFALETGHAALFRLTSSKAVELYYITITWLLVCVKIRGWNWRLVLLLQWDWSAAHRGWSLRTSIKICVVLHVGCLVKEDSHSKFPHPSIFCLIRLFGKDVDTNPIIATTILWIHVCHMFSMPSNNIEKWVCHIHVKTINPIEVA